MNYKVYHKFSEDEKSQYLVVIDRLTSINVEDLCVQHISGFVYESDLLVPFHKTLSDSLVGKVIAHVPMYDSKPLPNIPLLPEPTSIGKCTVELNISTLYTIFVSGFNLGSNEGPFPKNGAFEVFHNTIEGKPLSPDDNSYYAIKNKIKIKSIPKEFILHRVCEKDNTTLCLGEDIF